GDDRVTYGAAVAVDAAGARLPLETDLRARELVLRVPAAFVAAARLPLVIDPLIGSEQTVYTSSAARPLSHADIAYEPSWGEYAVCYQRYWSATDVDVFVDRFDAALNHITQHVIDLSLDS